MRLSRVGFIASGLFVFCMAASTARADHVVLRSGQRLDVTSYELVGSKYRLQIIGGSIEVPAEEVVAIQPEDVFVPNPPKPAPAIATDTPFGEFIVAASSRYSVDVDLIASVIAAESNFDPTAISRRNARGLMQLLPKTAAELGVKNIFDPKQNIEAGTHYLRDLLQRYNNDLKLALAAYNAGPNRVEQYKTIPPYSETISYVRRVQQNYEKRKHDASLKQASTNPASGFKKFVPASLPSASPEPASSTTPAVPSAMLTPVPDADTHTSTANNL